MANAFKFFDDEESVATCNKRPDEVFIIKQRYHQTLANILYVRGFY